MGVKDLWSLLAPCGTRVPMESLAGQRLAVDASIWLTQFIKAMTDENGRPLPGAHLQGMFHRICSLLALGVRPVVVFDGPAPMLKRQTIQQRQRQRKQARDTAASAAERILLSRMRATSIAQLRRKLTEKTSKAGEQAGGVASAERTDSGKTGEEAARAIDASTSSSSSASTAVTTSTVSTATSGSTRTRQLKKPRRGTLDSVSPVRRRVASVSPVRRRLASTSPIRKGLGGTSPRRARDGVSPARVTVSATTGTDTTATSTTATAGAGAAGARGGTIGSKSRGKTSRSRSRSRLRAAARSGDAARKSGNGGNSDGSSNGGRVVTLGPFPYAMPRGAVAATASNGNGAHNSLFSSASSASASVAALSSLSKSTLPSSSYSSLSSLSSTLSSARIARITARLARKINTHARTRPSTTPSSVFTASTSAASSSSLSSSSSSASPTAPASPTLDAIAADLALSWRASAVARHQRRMQGSERRRERDAAVLQAAALIRATEAAEGAGANADEAGRSANMGLVPTPEGGERKESRGYAEEGRAGCVVGLTEAAEEDAASRLHRQRAEVKRRVAASYNELHQREMAAMSDGRDSMGVTGKETGDDGVQMIDLEEEGERARASTGAGVGIGAGVGASAGDDDDVVEIAEPNWAEEGWDYYKPRKNRLSGGIPGSGKKVSESAFSGAGSPADGSSMVAKSNATADTGTVVDASVSASTAMAASTSTSTGIDAGMSTGGVGEGVSEGVDAGHGWEEDAWEAFGGGFFDEGVDSGSIAGSSGGVESSGGVVEGDQRLLASSSASTSAASSSSSSSSSSAATTSSFAARMRSAAATHRGKGGGGARADGIGVDSDAEDAAEIEEEIRAMEAMEQKKSQSSHLSSSLLGDSDDDDLADFDDEEEEEQEEGDNDDDEEKKRVKAQERVVRRIVSLAHKVILTAPQLAQLPLSLQYEVMELQRDLLKRDVGRQAFNTLRENAERAPNVFSEQQIRTFTETAVRMREVDRLRKVFAEELHEGGATEGEEVGESGSGGGERRQEKSARGREGDDGLMWEGRKINPENAKSALSGKAGPGSGGARGSTQASAPVRRVAGEKGMGYVYTQQATSSGAGSAGPGGLYRRNRGQTGESGAATGTGTGTSMGVEGEKIGRRRRNILALREKLRQMYRKEGDTSTEKIENTTGGQEGEEKRGTFKMEGSLEDILHRGQVLAEERQQQKLAEEEHLRKMYFRNNGNSGKSGISGFSIKQEHSDVAILGVGLNGKEKVESWIGKTEFPDASEIPGDLHSGSLIAKEEDVGFGWDDEVEGGDEVQEGIDATLFTPISGKTTSSGKPQKSRNRPPSGRSDKPLLEGIENLLEGLDDDFSGNTSFSGVFDDISEKSEFPDARDVFSHEFAEPVEDGWTDDVQYAYAHTTAEPIDGYAYAEDHPYLDDVIDNNEVIGDDGLATDGVGVVDAGVGAGMGAGLGAEEESDVEVVEVNVHADNILNNRGTSHHIVRATGRDQDMNEEGMSRGPGVVSELYENVYTLQNQDVPTSRKTSTPESSQKVLSEEVTVFSPPPLLPPSPGLAAASSMTENMDILPVLSSNVEMDTTTGETTEIQGNMDNMDINSGYGYVNEYEPQQPLSAASRLRRQIRKILEDRSAEEIPYVEIPDNEVPDELSMYVPLLGDGGDSDGVIEPAPASSTTTTAKTSEAGDALTAVTAEGSTASSKLSALAVANAFNPFAGSGQATSTLGKLTSAIPQTTTTTSTNDTSTSTSASARALTHPSLLSSSHPIAPYQPTRYIARTDTTNAGTGTGVSTSTLDLRGPSPEEELLVRLQALQRQQYSESAHIQSTAAATTTAATTVTPSMVADVKQLLQLMGVPYITAPAEAEAQCVWLEKLALVDGVISDDSDCIIFGAKKTFVHMFNHHEFVKMYNSDILLQELSLNQERLIYLALLLGSDYTPGIKGIGKVNAMEILSVFPNFSGLVEFREWVYSPPSRDLKPAPLKLTADMNEQEKIQRTFAYNKALFKYKHRNVKSKWDVSRTFPDLSLIEAYRNPPVDRSRMQFQWANVDVASVVSFMETKLGWHHSQTNRLLLPVLSRGEMTSQTRLLHLYGPTGRFSHVKSKRMREALLTMANAGVGKGNGNGKTAGTVGVSKAHILGVLADEMADDDAVDIDGDGAANNDADDMAAMGTSAGAGRNQAGAVGRAGQITEAEMEAMLELERERRRESDREREKEKESARMLDYMVDSSFLAAVGDSAAVDAGSKTASADAGGDAAVADRRAKTRSKRKRRGVIQEDDSDDDLEDDCNKDDDNGRQMVQNDAIELD